MDDDVADGTLIDLRGVDIGSLLAEPAESGTQTALDRILMSGAGGLNGFNNSIGNGLIKYPRAGKGPWVE
jgi:hypothetical protein